MVRKWDGLRVRKGERGKGREWEGKGMDYGWETVEGLRVGKGEGLWWERGKGYGTAHKGRNVIQIKFMIVEKKR
jgi:hypothetical protein